MDNVIYLDNASTTYPKPAEVHRAMYEFYSNYGVNPGRSSCKLSSKAENIITETRKLLMNFFNGGTDYNRLVFTYNVSDSLNMIINGILEKGDHVITSAIEHNSVLRPIYHKEMIGEVEVDYVPFNEGGFIDPDDIKRRIRKNTKLVIINHGSNVIGTVQPVKEIGAICRKNGVLFSVDTSQTAGVIPINMKEMNIDIVAFTSHKSLFGPTGIGGICIGEGVEIKPTRFGGTGIKSELRTYVDEYPYRLECGTLNIMGIAGLNAAQKFLKKKGIDNIFNHEMELIRMLYNEIKDMDKVKVYCADSFKNHIPVLSINIEGISSSEVGSLLNEEYGICTRTGLHCAPLVHKTLGTAPDGTVRFSVGLFNTEKDIKITIEAIKEISQFVKKKEPLKKIVSDEGC
ncbi:cysteine desulfurase [candidate division KSB1 bacterium]|nr:MAG: cysteine desulfurase [candidate division KSB1 bacterium]